MRAGDKGKAKSTAEGLLFGVLAALSILLGITALLTKLILIEKLHMESLGYAIVVCLIASSFIGASISIKKIQRRKAMVASMFAVVYLGTLLCLAAVLFGFDSSGICATAVTVFGGSEAAALLTRTKKSHYKR